MKEQTLTSKVDIDVDWMDGKFIRSMDFAFYDMTSNQFIVDAEISRPETRPLIEEVAREMRGVEWLDVYTRVVGLPFFFLSFFHTRGRFMQGAFLEQAAAL